MEKATKKEKEEAIKNSEEAEAKELMRKAGDKAKKEQGENEAADKEMKAKKAKQEEEASTAI